MPSMNPYNPNVCGDGLVDQMINKSYQVVRVVYDNLDHIKTVALFETTPADVSLVEAKEIDILVKKPGAAFIRLTDRKSSLWRRWVGAALDAQGEDKWWFLDGGDNVWILDEDWWTPEMLGSPAPLIDRTLVTADARPWIVELWRKFRADPTRFGVDMSGAYGLSDSVHYRVDVGNQLARIRVGTLVALPGSGGTDFLKVSLPSCAVCGQLRVYGTGAVDYATRTWTNGIALMGSNRMHLPDGWVAENFKNRSLYTSTLDADGNAGGNNIAMLIGDGREVNCGSAAGQVNASSLSYTFDSAVRTGSAGSTAQRVSVHFTTPLDAAIEPKSKFYYLDLSVTPNRREVYTVETISVDRQTVTFMEWLPDGVTAGSMISCHGGSLLEGGNTASCSFGRIDAFRVGVAVEDRGLYGSHIAQIQTQVSGINFARGNPPSSANYGGSLGGAHSESTLIDAVLSSSAENKGWMGPLSAQGVQTEGVLGHKIGQTVMCVPRQINGLRYSSSTLKGTVVWDELGPIWWEAGPIGGNNGSSTLTVTNRPSERWHRQRRNTNIVVFNPLADYAITHSGKNWMQVELVGDSGAPHAPTGTQTLRLHADRIADGWTMNGGTADIVLTALKAPLRVIAELNPATKTLCVLLEAIAPQPRAGTAIIPNGATEIAVTFGTNRADANYAVGLTPLGNEAVWLKATPTSSGFTIQRTGTTGARTVHWTTADFVNN